MPHESVVVIARPADAILLKKESEEHTHMSSWLGITIVYSCSEAGCAAPDRASKLKPSKLPLPGAEGFAQMLSLPEVFGKVEVASCEGGVKHMKRRTKAGSTPLSMPREVMA